jgi:hypothetical protein
MDAYRREYEGVQYSAYRFSLTPNNGFLESAAFKESQRIARRINLRCVSGRRPAPDRKCKKESCSYVGL